MQGFFDEEAELGSDDENNDDNRKHINKKDIEEIEDGLDNDLDGFVVRAGDDDEVIPDAEANALSKFQQDMMDDDKQRTRDVMQAAIFGRNKKRKRGEVEGLDEEEMDDFERRKQERIAERERQLNSQDDDEMETHLLEGTARARDIMKIKILAEEEELSENEIQEQMETNNYYKFLKERSVQNVMKEMNKKEQ